jgi:hypothetical protein
MIDREEETSKSLKDIQTAKDSLELCEKIINLFNGVNAEVAIPVTCVVMARVLMECCKSRQEGYATLSINMSKIYELMSMLYDVSDEEDEEDEEHTIQ